MKDSYQIVCKRREKYINGVNRDFLKIAKDKGLNWLDIGSGDSIRSAYLNTILGKKLTVLEPSELLTKDFECSNPDIKFLRTSIEEIEFLEKFDVISLLWNVVGHLTNLEATLKKIYNALHPGGVLYFDTNSPFNLIEYGVRQVVKNFFSKQEYLKFSWPDSNSESYVLFYKKSYLIKILKEAGFSVSVRNINYDSGNSVRSCFFGSMVVTAKKSSEI
jgi:2-polyprenyl-3-methyl-5-hydroxy-6-metoxy-1,4-benzoquinol methylase